MLAHRPATAADIAELHALIENAYRGETSRAGWTHEADYLTRPRTSADELAAIIADPRQGFLLAVDDGKIAACIQLTDRGDGTAYLGMLAVDPVRQAQGVGKVVLAAAEARARDFGATRIEMTVVDRRATLIAYYERRGYALTGEVRAFPAALLEAVPLAFVVMTKPL